MQQMKKDGVRPDIHTYTSFINACCKAGDMQVCSLVSNYLFPIVPLVKISLHYFSIFLFVVGWVLVGILGFFRSLEIVLFK